MGARLWFISVAMKGNLKYAKYGGFYSGNLEIKCD